MTSHEALQERQLSVKEVSASRHNRNGELLRAGPIHHGGKRHRVVFFAMHEERSFMHVRWKRGHGEARSGSADEHELFDRSRIPQADRRIRCNERPE